MLFFVKNIIKCNDMSHKNDNFAVETKRLFSDNSDRLIIKQKY